MVNGVLIEEMTLSALRRSIAIVPQDSALFNISLRDNVGFGNPNATDREIVEAARVAGLNEVVARLPLGWDTIVGEQGLRLSGGERQRVAIARAVVKKPRLFIFDEATSSLDSRTERQIQESIANASAGVTTLIIAHRLSTVMAAEEILVLEDGKIVERGRHPELLDANAHYAAMWAAQLTGTETEHR